MISISIEFVNSQSPYKVFGTDSGTLKFRTDNNGLYEVCFVLDESLRKRQNYA